MTPEERKQVERAFFDACDLDSSERAGFLQEAFGENEILRAEVESLLAFDEELRRQAGEISPSEEARAVNGDIRHFGDSNAHAEAAHPDRIGQYKVLDVLGEGGMGVVYLVEQREPIRRRVALKVIKPGMNTNEVVARFESERQALAVMDHPNIARVYDAGATGDGRPYFVMEHVRGVRLDQYCDRHQLTIRERLGLFLQVCEGVHHAHLQGIIHRDLKPANVLVATCDEEPVAKIIDFGVARATNQRLTERTIYTELGRAVGTPAYMSPEQAEMTREDVDHRTDVYSLGVILYELLVGELPMDSEVFAKTAFDEILRRIREDEPPTPSMRLSRLNPERTTELAARRRTSPRVLCSALRHDLDWITVKGLEKDRNRRYSTASELAADIKRHLHGERVMAGPPSIEYRLQRFLKKNRGPVTAVAAVMAVLVLGLGVSMSLYLKASDALRDVQEERDKVLRLSDIRRLEEHVAELSDLWPCVPEKAPSMRRWLGIAKDLFSRLPMHEQRLAQLRSQALPYDEASPEDDGKADSRVGDLADPIGARRSTLEIMAGNEQPGSTVALEAGIVQQSKEVSGPHTWRFETTELDWQHKVLAELISGLRALPEMIADVEERLQFAENVQRLSIENHRAAWDEAIRSIRDPKECPVYQGLVIKPQVGLVPIGRDPVSGLWEFAHIQSGRIPRRDGNDKLILRGDMCVVLVLIPGGRFTMGAIRPSAERPPGTPNVDPYSGPDESPLNEVTLDAFFMSKFEMTQGQWEHLTKENPSRYRMGVYWGTRVGKLNPVERVTWDMARRILLQADLDLPTEAQWEYATRAGTTSAWWTGGDLESLSGKGNFAERSAQKAGITGFAVPALDLEDHYAVHAPVGTFSPNPWGLHEVHGNVWEWCRDWYGSYDLDVRPGDGEREVSERRARVGRGGGFSFGDGLARSADRSNAPPSTAMEFLGLRPSRSLAMD